MVLTRIAATYPSKKNFNGGKWFYFDFAARRVGLLAIFALFRVTNSVEEIKKADIRLAKKHPLGDNCPYCEARFTSKTG